MFHSSNKIIEYKADNYFLPLLNNIKEYYSYSTKDFGNNFLINYYFINDAEFYFEKTYFLNVTNCTIPSIIIINNKQILKKNFLIFV